MTKDDYYIHADSLTDAKRYLRVIVDTHLPPVEKKLVRFSVDDAPIRYTALEPKQLIFPDDLLELLLHEVLPDANPEDFTMETVPEDIPPGRCRIIRRKP